MAISLISRFETQEEVEFNSTGEVFDNFILDRSKDYKVKKIKISGVKFKGNTIIDGLQNLDFISFYKCTFDSLFIKRCSGNFINVNGANLIIDACEINSLELKMADFKNGIVVRNSKINLLTYLNSCLFDGKIRIESDGQISDRFSLAYLYFENLTETNFHFNNHKNIGKTTFRRTTGKVMDISKCTFGEEVVFRKLEYDNVEIAKGNEFNGDVLLKGCQFFDGFSIISSTFNQALHISLLDDEDKEEMGFIESLKLHSPVFNNGFTCEGVHDRLKECQIGSINVFVSDLSKGNIYFGYFSTDKIFFSGTNKNCNILIYNLSTNSLEMNYFLNYSYLNIHNLKIITDSNSNLELIHSELGNGKLQDIDFSSFDKVTIDGTSIGDLKNSNIVWFDFKKVEYSLMQRQNNLLDLYRKLRELARTLKHNSAKQENFVDYLHFRKEEFRYFSKELREKSFFKDLPNKIALIFSYTTNLHGTNWFIPIGWIIAISFIVWTQFLLINFQIVSIYDLGHYYSENWSIVPYMLNPTNSMKEYSDYFSNVSTRFLFVEYFYKVILSFLLVQTVTAFRKYIK